MRRRSLVFAALLFWLGGATFYAFVVIPIGLTTLQPPSDQTFVTQGVTNVLNLSAPAVLGLFAWDVFLGRDPSVARRRWRRGLLAAQLATVATLLFLHLRMDALMDRALLRILDRAAMRPLHHAYLSVSATQWACGTAFAFLTLWAWRAEDVNERDG